MDLIWLSTPAWCVHENTERGHLDLTRFLRVRFTDASKLGNSLASGLRSASWWLSLVNAPLRVESLSLDWRAISLNTKSRAPVQHHT